MKYDKINLNRTPLSADEINGAMDFEGLLNPQATPAAKGGGKVIKLGMYSLAAAAVLAAGIYLWSNQSESTLTEDSSSEVNTTLAADETKEKHVPLIDPPVKGYEKEFLTAMINVAEGGEVKLGESTINVPSNAFLDAEGNLLKGDVELRYREFNDVLDIFLSGIPMEYDSAGVNYTFESNGMFELRGFQKGAEVMIAPEKDLEVKMEIAERMAGFSEYYLNEETGVWDFRNGQQYEELENNVLVADNGGGTTHVVKKIGPVSETSLQLSSLENPSEYHTYEFTNPSTHITEKLIVSKEAKDELMQLNTDISEVKKEKTAKKKEEPTKPTKGNPALPQIELDVDYSEFPELKAFKNTLFQVAEEDLDDFKPEWGQVEWTDMKINKSAKEGYYRLVFSKPGRREMVKAAPVLSEVDMADALKTYDSLFGKYQNSLDSLDVVKKEKEAALAAARAKAKAESKKREKELLEQRAAIAAGNEIAKKKYREDQLAGASDERKAQIKQNFTRQDISAVFNVGGFGYYNCDSPQVFPRGRAVLAEYVNQNEESIGVSATLVEKGKRAMFSMGNKLTFNDSAENLLVTVTPSNKIAVLSPSEFNEINKGSRKKCVIKMKECEKELTSKEEIKEFIEAQGFEI